MTTSLDPSTAPSVRRHHGLVPSDPLAERLAARGAYTGFGPRGDPFPSQSAYDRIESAASGV